VRITVFDPHQKLTASITEDMLLLAGVKVAPEVIGQWTPNEMALAYDWAAREHLSASDNPVQRRPRPWFVTLSMQPWIRPVAVYGETRTVLMEAL